MSFNSERTVGVGGFPHLLSVGEQSKGGRASGESRRKKKAIRESLQALLDGDVEIDGRLVQGADGIALAMFQKALDGNVSAAEFVRDCTDGRPSTRLEMQACEISPEAYERVRRALEDD